jgi:hypothetical protein
MSNGQLVTNMNETNARQALELIELAQQNIELGYQIADLHRQLQEAHTTVARLQRRQAELEAALTWTLASGVEALTMADYTEDIAHDLSN